MQGLPRRRFRKPRDCLAAGPDDIIHCRIVCKINKKRKCTYKRRRPLVNLSKARERETGGDYRIMREERDARAKKD